MSLIKITESDRLIPISFFEVCHEDGKTRNEIAKLYKHEEVTKNKSCYFILKFEHHLKQMGLSLKDYLKKHLEGPWPLCPVSGKEVGVGKISGKGISVPKFTTSGNKEFSPKFKEYCDKISKERSGAGNPMFGQKPWNIGLTADTDNRLKIVAEKRTGIKMEESSKEKMRQRRRESPLKARHTTKHSEESKDIMRQKTAEGWANGRFNKVTSIHRKIKEFLESLSFKESWEEEFQAKYFALDFAFPNSKVCIECQGTFFHIDPRVYPNGPITKIQKRNHGRDKAKRTYLENRGWTIIELWEIEINNGEFKDYLTCKLKELNLLDL